MPSLSKPLPEQVTLRRATVEDAVVLAEHRGRMFEAMGESEEAAPELLAPNIEYFEREVPIGGFVAWVAAADGDVIGTAGALIFAGPPMAVVPDGRVARVQNVFVDDGWRRRGIATALLVALLDDLHSDGVTRALLVASDEGRPLYEMLGFETIPSMAMALDEWEQQRP